MKIFFLKRGNEKLGSNRIYIENLSFWMSKLKVNVFKSHIIKKDYDIYILSKYCSIKDLNAIRKINHGKKILCGIIHPTSLSISGKKLINQTDFVIVGSIEEQDYYKRYKKNVFRFPQIENIRPLNKLHKNNKIINIGYHGNLEHLEEMSSSTKIALEKISKKYQILLTVIYDKKLGKWVKGRPNIKIKEVNWSFKNLISEISKFDIGIVPCTNNFFLDKPLTEMNYFTKILKNFSGGKNRRLNDYILRFKATSNSGRAFIFHQLGIPVVADFWPSNFEILGSQECGFLAHSEQGWYSALDKLIRSPLLRSKISKNAKKTFLKNYDPINWTKHLIGELKKI